MLRRAKDRQPLADWLAQSLPNTPREEYALLLAKRRIQVNGRPASTLELTLEPGDRIRLTPLPPATSRSRARGDDRPLGSGNANHRAKQPKRHPSARPAPRFAGRGVSILYEDDDLLVVEKPPGLRTARPTAPGAKPTLATDRNPTLFDIARRYLSRSVLQRPGMKRTFQPKLWIIYRLDRPTSGVVVFAKSQPARDAIKDQIADNALDLSFLAVCSPPLGDRGQTFTHQSSAPVRQTKGKSDRDDRRGPRVTTSRFRVERSTPNVSLVAARPDRPSTEMVAQHLEELKHPVVVTRPAKSDYTQLAIHAHTVRLEHPTTRQTVSFTSEPPAYFDGLLRSAEPSALEGKRAHEPTPEQQAPRPISAPSTPAPPAPVDTIPPAPAAPPAFDAYTEPVEISTTTTTPEITDKPASEADPRPATQTSAQPAAQQDTSWQNVAEWYDQLLEPDAHNAKPNDHYENTILPGALRLLAPKPAEHVLDVACGQGILARQLADQQCAVTAIDAAQDLITAAKSRLAPGKPFIDYRHHDARHLTQFLEDVGRTESFDAAACVMAITNIDPFEPVIAGVSRALKPGGRFVMILSHPAFRIPDHSSWQWDDRDNAQYRRVDAYLTPSHKDIRMHPGSDASITTRTFHRPLQFYTNVLASHNLLTQTLEEWPADRVSEPGPRADEENRIRREIPLFLAIKAVKPV